MASRLPSKTMSRLWRLFFFAKGKYSSLVMREILQEPSPVLHQKAEEVPVANILSDKIQTLIKDMKDALLEEHYGVAIAAPQIGESIRIFIVSGRVFAARKAEEYDPKKHFPEVYINPNIVSTSKKQTEMQEGCLSVRGKWGKVMRAERTTIEAYDESGEKISRGASGLLAQIFQHEMDHLNGILYIDKAIDVWDDTDEGNEEKNEKE